MSSLSNHQEIFPRRSRIAQLGVSQAAQSPRTQSSGAQSSGAQSPAAEAKPFSLTKDAVKDPTELIEGLRSQLKSLENVKHQRLDDGSIERLSSGIAGLDNMLPAGGFLPGQLIEWMVDGSGHGGGTLALLVARNISNHDSIFSDPSSVNQKIKTIVVVDRPQRITTLDRSSAAFYPPAAAEMGVLLRHLIVLRPESATDELWALDQALRCPGIGAVWSWLPKLGDRDFRRLQLAAEAGGSLGLLLRPACLRGQPTWSDIQFLVKPAPQNGSETSRLATAAQDGDRQSGDRQGLQRCWQVTLLRCRGGAAGAQCLLELDETNGQIQEATHTHPHQSQ